MSSLDGKCTARFHRHNGRVLRCIRPDGHRNGHQSSGDVHVWRSREPSNGKAAVWICGGVWRITYFHQDGHFTTDDAETIDEAWRIAHKVVTR